MGCIASKQDAKDTNPRSRPRNMSMSMPVQAQGNGDNGYHMVALTSSTYGILKVDNPKTSVVSPNGSHDAFLEKLKHFDIPDEMHSKSWSEVARHLPKIPPPTRTDSPRLQTRGLDSPRLQARGLDSPRLQTRGLDSPRLQTRGLDSPRLQARGLNSPRLQTRGLDSPRLQTRGLDSPRGTNSARLRGDFRQMGSVPSQVAKNDHETINTWELMDGLDENGNALENRKLRSVGRTSDSPLVKSFGSSVAFSSANAHAFEKPKLRPVERTSNSPSMKPFGGSVTLSTTHGNSFEKPKLRPVERAPDSPSVKPFGSPATFSTTQGNSFEKPKLRLVERASDSPSIKPFGSPATFSTTHGNAFEKPKLKPLGRTPASPSIKPIERAVTFSTIHTLSELDTGDPSKAIALGPAAYFLNSSNSVGNGRRENTNPVRAVSRSTSSPVVPLE